MTEQEKFHIFLCVCFDCYCQTLISWRKTVHEAMPALKFEIFLTFPNLRRSTLKLFGNSWSDSYTKFVILDIKVGFTCGESDLYQNIVKVQNIFPLFSILSMIIQISWKNNYLAQKCKFYLKTTNNQGWKVSKVKFWHNQIC